MIGELTSIFLMSAIYLFGGGWPTLTLLSKGGTDEVGGHGWKIVVQTALVPTFAKSQRWASHVRRVKR